MLGDKGLGSYRSLLESVSLHPMMGVYLSHLRNQKADARTGRVPDENYAREVMQLFSIGLVELNDDGSARTSGGAAIETYTPADISGLAKVFTGWSWACPDWPDNSCFSRGNAGGSERPRPELQGRCWATRSTTAPRRRPSSARRSRRRPPSDPTASLRTALDTLAGAPQRRPLHRPPADPAPGHQQPEPGLRARRGARLRRQRPGRARRHEGRAQGRADAPRGAHAVGHRRQGARAGAAPVGLPARLPAPQRHRHLARRQHRQPRHVAGPDADALAVGVQLLPAGLRAAGHRGRRQRRWSRRSCRSPTRPAPPAT